ncbi:hypothetical protein CIHG_01051 [Coccidioides immitis H538.4]|uniref:Uncharacterized protein n=2 Tax=Coccidioides immitis TaxID=5501 RepID=A0A0J8RGY9_COCIT|nr:hypothetical protein CIRG_03457 [Coccidioides immitis RMSCC 2394]KMU83269.1 hypothetical protein CIHG_01051 [Coccidioides immitis H538.4]
MRTGYPPFSWKVVFAIPTCFTGSSPLRSFKSIPVHGLAQALAQRSGHGDLTRIKAPRLAKHWLDSDLDLSLALRVSRDLECDLKIVHSATPYTLHRINPPFLLEGPESMEQGTKAISEDEKED